MLAIRCRLRQIADESAPTVRHLGWPTHAGRSGFIREGPRFLEEDSSYSRPAGAYGAGSMTGLRSSSRSVSNWQEAGASTSPLR